MGSSHGQVLRYHYCLLKAQTKAGAQVVQLFDSWVVCISPTDYRDYVLPHIQKLFQALRKEGIPSIHFGTGTAALLDVMAEAGGDIIGVDWRISLDNAWQCIGGPVFRGISTRWLSGSLDGSQPEKAAEVLERSRRRAGPYI